VAAAEAGQGSRHPAGRRAAAHTQPRSGVSSLQGTVTGVTAEYIFVDGRSYALQGVRLVRPDGRPVQVSQIVRGMRADVYFERGAVSSIVVSECTLQ